MSSIRTGGKYVHRDFDYGMVAGARQAGKRIQASGCLNNSERADLLWVFTDDRLYILDRMVQNKQQQQKKEH